MITQILKKIVKFFAYEIRNVHTQDVLYQVDVPFNVLYQTAQKGTQMESTDNFLRRQRHYGLYHLIRSVDVSHGDVCEIGCWRGLSAYQIASYLQLMNFYSSFHIFDSFEGLSMIQHDDRSGLERNDEKLRKHFACSFNEVKNNLREFDFIQYYPGWIPNRFSAVENRRFIFVHVDVDLYQPIRDSFEFFYPRLQPGGIMVFDDYGCLQFPGAKKAIDECIQKYHNGLFLPLSSGQAFLLKNV